MSMTSEHLPDNEALQGLYRRLGLAVLAIIILVVSVGASFWMLNTIPRSRRRKPRQYATLVQIRQLQWQRKQIAIEAMGTVQAARQVVLFGRVRGEVVRVSKSLLPGGLVRRGQWLLRIDPADYRLAVTQRQSALVQAQASLALEQGRQQIARKEYAMLPKVAARHRKLMLRGPQLATAKAQVQAAQAALRLARLQLRRTLLRAPFDGVIVRRLAHPGSRVNENTALVEVAGTRRYWVELALAVDLLRWVKFPQKGGKGGSQVRIFAPGGGASGHKGYRMGQILRLLPTLEARGRMARVLVQVDDPLGLQSKRGPRLLLGSYVKAQILGRRSPRVIALPRQYLRDNQTVWLMGSDSALKIRKVSVLYRGSEEVLIDSGLGPGDRLITTLLPTPIAGMPLRSEAQVRRRMRRQRKPR